ncbi:unnamed protein product [Closterium sp. NIES-64]|nr:unnamed protein product [Closterium sp. NIES-64]
MGSLVVETAASPRKPQPQLAFPRSVSSPGATSLSAAPPPAALLARQQFPSSKSLPTPHDHPVVPSDESSATAPAVRFSTATRASANHGSNDAGVITASPLLAVSRTELVVAQVESHVEPSYSLTPHPPSFPPSPTASTSRLRLSRFRSVAPSAAAPAAAAAPTAAHAAAPPAATSAATFQPASHVDMSSRLAHTRPRPNLRVDLPSSQSHPDALSTQSHSIFSPDTSPAPSPPFTAPILPPPLVLLSAAQLGYSPRYGHTGAKNSIRAGPDLLPIEAARVRFLHLIIDHFVTYHIVPISEESQLAASHSPGERRKRRAREMEDGQPPVEQQVIRPSYEGDPRHLLPLIFLANAYETLVGEVNGRMAEMDVLRGKTMGLALEAAGGLYRRMVEKFPKSGGYQGSQGDDISTRSQWALPPAGAGVERRGAVTIFRRREMASALEARARFPQLVLGRDDKRVRFIVVHGLELVERPSTMSPDDAEWFKRITGRHEVAIYPRDFKYFTPRPKPRRVPQPSVSAVSVANPAELAAPMHHMVRAGTKEGKGGGAVGEGTERVPQASVSAVSVANPAELAAPMHHMVSYGPPHGHPQQGGMPGHQQMGPGGGMPLGHLPQGPGGPLGHLQGGEGAARHGAGGACASAFAEGVAAFWVAPPGHGSHPGGGGAAGHGAGGGMCLCICRGGCCLLGRITWPWFSPRFNLWLNIHAAVSAAAA